jgi:hypothetical protein
MFLRWLSIVIALGCIVPPAARADSDIPVHAGLWSLELGVQTLSGSGNLIGVAAKHHLGDRTAIRMGFAGIITGSDVDETRKDVFSDPDTSVTVPESRRGGSTDRRDVTIFAHWVRYHGLDEHFGMTLEAGPTVHWSSTESLDKFTFPESAPGGPEQSEVFLQDSNSWEYGLDLQVGFEWFFTRHVSLAARYGIAALRTEERSTLDDTLTSDYFGINGHQYQETHSDGFVVRTTFPLVSLNASW